MTTHTSMDQALRVRNVWVLPGLRTAFAKSDGALKAMDAIELSVPVASAMIEQIDSGLPDFVVWGTMLPNLTWSNIAREVLLDAGVGATVPAFSTVMACSSSMIGAIEAAAMLDDHEDHSRLSVVPKASAACRSR